MQDILNEDVGIFISSHITETLKNLADYLMFADNGTISFHCPEQMDAFLADQIKTLTFTNPRLIVLKFLGGDLYEP